MDWVWKRAEKRAQTFLEGVGTTKSRGRENKENICLLCPHPCATSQRSEALLGFGASGGSASSAWEHP